jgi:hypothetical protein
MVTRLASMLLYMYIACFIYRDLVPRLEFPSLKQMNLYRIFRNHNNRFCRLLSRIKWLIHDLCSSEYKIEFTLQALSLILCRFYLSW